MSEAIEKLKCASRRKLQALAKELQLCKGNAKSDVIVSHAMQYLDSHRKDGEQVILDLLGGDIETPVASPIVKKVTHTKQKKLDAGGTRVKVEETVKETKSDKLQPEAEPTDSEETRTLKKKITTNSKSVTEVKSALAKATTSASIRSPKTDVKASHSTKKPSVYTTPPASEERQTTPTKKSPGKKVAPLTGFKTRKDVEVLVKSIPDLTFVGDSRVRCSATGHEMKADVDIINTYVRGKRYQKARNLKLSFAKYGPMFVDHPDESKPDLLWCRVTELAIVRDENSVKMHMAGPKYQKQLPIWQQEEAAKKRAEEEEALRRAARIEAAKKRRLKAAKDDSADTLTCKQSVKRKRTTASSDQK